MPNSKAYLKALRKKHGLGEFSSKSRSRSGKKRRKTGTVRTAASRRSGPARTNNPAETRFQLFPRF